MQRRLKDGLELAQSLKDMEDPTPRLVFQHGNYGTLDDFLEQMSLLVALVT